MPSRFKRGDKLPLALSTVKATKQDVLQNREIKEIKKRVGRLSIGNELKYFTCNSVNAQAVAHFVGPIDPPSFLLSGIGQGTTVKLRIGNYCVAKKLMQKGNVYSSIAAAKLQVRHVIFWDSEPVINGTEGPVWSLVFDTASTFANAFWALPKFENRKRFHIIYDKVYDDWDRHHPDNTAAALANQNFKVTKIKRVNNAALNYRSATATDIVGKHLYMFMVCSIDNTAGTVLQNIEGHLQFKDD